MKVSFWLKYFRIISHTTWASEIVSNKRKKTMFNIFLALLLAKLSIKLKFTFKKN